MELKSCSQEAITVYTRPGSARYVAHGMLGINSSLYERWNHVSFTWIHGSKNSLAIFLNGVKIKETTVSSVR